MSNDLIERLRENYSKDSFLMEIADLIESQAKRVAELEVAIHYCRQLTDCVQPEETSRDVWHKWCIQKDALAALKDNQ